MYVVSGRANENGRLYAFKGKIHLSVTGKDYLLHSYSVWEAIVISLINGKSWDGQNCSKSFFFPIKD